MRTTDIWHYGSRALINAWGDPLARSWGGSYPTMEGAIRALDPFQRDAYDLQHTRALVDNYANIYGE